MSPKRAISRRTKRPRATKSKGRPAAARAPAARPEEAADQGAIYVNIPGQRVLQLHIEDERALQADAIRWTYSLRNRERWNTELRAAAKQQLEIAHLAERLGLNRDHIETIAKAEIAEVDVPWTGEERNWESRIFPWEYMLATVTRDARRGRPITIVRRLRMNRRPTCPPPDSWMQVISAPGKIAAKFDFTSETEILRVSLGSMGEDLRVVKNPDVNILRHEVERRSPAVIHLSGVDSHQGWSILNPHHDIMERDGYFLCSRDKASVAVDAESLSEILTGGPARKPALISCNIYNSGARIAPICVSRGACAAIGFQDSFDDDLSELFFSTLYQAWRAAEWKLVPAFHFAWQTVREKGLPLKGSGVVLWSEESIVGEAPVAEDAPEDRHRKAIREKWRPTHIPLDATNVRDKLEVDIELISQLNYSLLHNNGPIFRRFRILKKDVGIGRVDGLLVNVELHVGTDSYPFRMKVAMEDTALKVDLPEAIRLSLASTLGRAIRESIHTSLFVEVLWEDTVLYRRTHRVTLLPVDEWRYDTSNYRWLPSFVLPRDPAVLRIVDASQRYLMALRDDATAGFDGYQCVDTRGGKVQPEECTMVDMQVRALWSALLYECPLSYINPPPTFTDSSQRLRTPSDCVDGKRGTCIDLALLFASCLEYVEIYGAVFLLRTHAFPAYWRHDSFHEEFRVARSSAVAVEKETGKGQPTFAPGQSFGWDLQPSQYRELLGEVQAGRLVPLETTLVTGRGSFADAIAGGVQNLASRREFESMLDIQLARSDPKSSVTPLPIRRSEV